MKRRKQTIPRLVVGTIAICAASAMSAREARAEDAAKASAPVASAWEQAFRAARAELDRGDLSLAYVHFTELAASAKTPEDRRLATELAAVCRTQLEHKYGPRVPVGPGAPRIRTSDELSVLYGTAFLYGLGTGAWFVLEARPSSVPAAIGPFAGITIASVGAVSIVDRYRPFEPGVPQSIAAGTYLGLGQSAWVVGYQQARAARIKDASGYDTAWGAPEVATVLWAGATGGAAVGAIVGTQRRPSPGRVSYTLSLALWSGALFGFGAGAVLPSERRVENALIIGGGAYNAGMLTGLATGASVSPSLTRVRIVDLGGVTGGLVGAATYLASSEKSQRATFGATAIGAAVGLGTAWLATSGMPSADPLAKVLPAGVTTALVPTPGGVEVRAGYTM